MSYLANKKKNFENRTVRTRFGGEGGTNGRTDKSTKDRYLMSYIANKKSILKIGRLELVLEGGGVRTDGHLADVKTYFPFFKFFRIKKRKVG